MRGSITGPTNAESPGAWLIFMPVYCWSDSAVVLSWDIRDESSRFQTFIYNRISLIQEMSNAIEWHYVPTACNTPDILSRASHPSELIESSLLSHGPNYLQEDKSHWPESCLAPKALPELRKRALITLKIPADIDIPTSCKFVNSWEKLKHVSYSIRHSGLTVNHLTGGMKLIIRSIQMAHLTKDYMPCSTVDK